MFVVPLAQPGLAVESDSPAASSDTDGADFATLMAAMAAASLAPAPTLALPSTVTGQAAGGAPQAGNTESLGAGAPALLPAFGWAATSVPVSMAGATPGNGAGEPPAAAAPTEPAAGSLGTVASGSPGTPASAAPVLGSPGEGPAVPPSAAPSTAAAPAAVPAGGPASEAVAGIAEASGQQNGPIGGTTRAKISQPTGAASPNPAAVPVTIHPSFPAEATGEASTGEPGSKTVAAAGPGHDHFAAPGAPAGGPLLAAETSRTADAPSNSSAVQHPPVVDQVVSVVEPLHHRGDGHHELTLDLRPAELGPIRVEVSIDQGTVHLSLHADEASPGTLLHQAMPELRAALEEAGLVTGRLGVGPGDREGGRPPAQSLPTEGDEPTAGRPNGAAAAAIRPPAAPAAGALDLLL